MSDAIRATLDEHFWHPPVPNKKHPMGYGGCYCGWQVPRELYSSPIGKYNDHLRDALVKADALAETCHCGRPVFVNDAIEPGFTRGLCEHCDTVRCDAYPGDCGL